MWPCTLSDPPKDKEQTEALAEYGGKTSQWFCRCYKDEGLRFGGAEESRCSGLTWVRGWDGMSSEGSLWAKKSRGGLLWVRVHLVLWFFILTPIFFLSSPFLHLLPSSLPFSRSTVPLVLLTYPFFSSPCFSPILRDCYLYNKWEKRCGLCSRWQKNSEKFPILALGKYIICIEWDRLSDGLTLCRHASGRLCCEGTTCMHGECERRKDVGLKCGSDCHLGLGLPLTIGLWVW